MARTERSPHVRKSSCQKKSSFTSPIFCVCRDKIREFVVEHRLSEHQCFDGSKGEHMSRRKGLESPMIKKASSQESNYVESRLRGVAITVHA